MPYMSRRAVTTVDK